MQEEIEEIWKDVVGYEGLYRVSSFGRVFGVKANKLRKISSIFNGYLTLDFSKNKVIKSKKVHSVVAEAFICKDYINRGLVVNHKDHNRANNNLSNLELITQRENANLKHIPSSSKYTGVSFNKKNKSWIAEIIFNKKSIYLGSFKSEIEASKYYEDALICINEGRPQDIVVRRREAKGYTFEKKSNRWVAMIYINKKTIKIGRYKTQEEAREAYLKYKKEHA
jgi:hypothetical protein